MKDWWKGLIRIETSLISENTGTGIFVMNYRYPIAEKVCEDCETSRDLIDDDDFLLGKLWLLQGTEISKNDNGLQV